MTQVATLPEPTVAEQAVAEQKNVTQTVNNQSQTSRFPRQGEWTYEDWLELPNDGWKYEIIDGVLYMSPPPLIRHQDVSGELFSEMRIYARRNKLGKVLEAPCGVRLPGQKVPVEPDILFVKQERLNIIEERYVEGAPDLIVEILSPSNMNYDLETKFNLYQNAGVSEYWLVNTWDKTVAIYHLADGAYTLTGSYGADDTVGSTVLNGFSIAVTTLFDF
jgi:Uma2 family endonuclease